MLVEISRDGLTGLVGMDVTRVVSIVVGLAQNLNQRAAGLVG